jgi:hypothetical protein
MKCMARQDADAPASRECRALRSIIEDDISRSGKSPGYRSFHAVITMLFHACLNVYIKKSVFVSRIN